MGHRQIRLAQLIAPFGPGALYTDKNGIPYVVCGLDYWHQAMDPTRGMVPCERPDEFERLEPRLADVLRVSRFRVPPDFRPRLRGQTPPPNAGLYIPGLRFPTWYRHTTTGALKRFNLTTRRLSAADGGRWQPARFVTVCRVGHLSEFPWREWCGCACVDAPSLVLQDRGGSELSSVVVECKTCGKRRSLSGATTRAEEGEASPFEKAGIKCSGARPWLGDAAAEGCTAQLVGALINQTNLYFPRTISAIALPDLREQDPQVLQVLAECRDDPSVSAIHLLWSMNARAAARDGMLSALKERGIVTTAEQVEKALESLFDPDAIILEGEEQPGAPDSEMLAFRRSEYNVLKLGMDDPIRSPDLRVVLSDVPERFDPWIERVHLVERLRETRVLYGFDRLETSNTPLSGMPDTAMHQLFANPPMNPAERWLPAVEVFGEGIFIQLKEDAIRDWQLRNGAWLANRLKDGFVARMRDVYQTNPPSGPVDWRWASRYMLVHSLAHIMISQLVFESGYGTASLKERLYIAEDDTAPMAGFLIYTAAGDSEGTLGGLVQLGSPERLSEVVERALARASWCSADPICSENTTGTGARLANLAACHACILLPETACETINHALDRALVVGTPTEPGRGAFSSLLGGLGQIS